MADAISTDPPRPGPTEPGRDAGSDGRAAAEEPPSRTARLTAWARRLWRAPWSAIALRKARRLWTFVTEFKLWALALIVGVASGYAAVGFMKTVEILNTTLFGASDVGLASAAANAPAWLLFLAPAVGGLIVGLLYRAFDRPLQPVGVADVIATRALRHAKIDPKDGVLSSLGAAISLGFGASGGREGPVVVAGAAISSFVSTRLNLSSLEARTLLGCAVAAAVSASFNAPIAGALFALEVVLGHYAVRAFAPITIASVAGAVISRTHVGVEPAFQIPSVEFGSYTQFPAFFLLGLVSAAVAVTMMASIFLARDVIDGLRERARTPLWLQPALVGLAVGAIAVFFPHILAVGYQTTSMALAGALSLELCILFAVVKTVAVAITLGGRFPSGVFSPALMVGALTGAAFGSNATGLSPAAAGDQALYAHAGMGAVAGAVLGAPISTTLIVFELTGDYATAIAVMVSTSVATVAVQQTVQKSYFHWQLSLKKINLCSGPESFLLRDLTVATLMRARGDENNTASDTAAWSLIDQGAALEKTECLNTALPKFNQGAMTWLPVVDARSEGGGRTLIGALYYVDALRAYNRALIDVHAEEHS